MSTAPSCSQRYCDRGLSHHTYDSECEYETRPLQHTCCLTIDQGRHGNCSLPRRALALLLRDRRMILLGLYPAFHRCVMLFPMFLQLSETFIDTPLTHEAVSSPNP